MPDSSLKEFSNLKKITHIMGIIFIFADEQQGIFREKHDHTRAIQSLTNSKNKHCTKST
ncbi:UNKNOWN [Stylonychia lemnae]|uniref:Uncharacterized protein n=1 Tax=Stylonychia lemnae TaxID=5949 RepID=A0A077ZYU4_STYLE|nr:UNKNOWN [Stylonychia lemnae]|eukprot:CDW73708.1 UNKNOWN [Stylonychia lemnae]